MRSSEIATFGGTAARQRMLSTGRIGKSWAANYTVTSRLPLHPSLGPPNTDYVPFMSHTSLSHAALSFVHGGLSPTYHDLTPFPSRINELGAGLLRKIHSHPPAPPSPPHPYSGLPHDANEAEKELYEANGPLWYRGWALEPEDKVCSQVDDVLKRTGTRRMVMGHTPDFEVCHLNCVQCIYSLSCSISRQDAGGRYSSSTQVGHPLRRIPHMPSNQSRRHLACIWRRALRTLNRLYVDSLVYVKLALRNPLARARSRDGVISWSAARPYRRRAGDRGCFRRMIEL